MTKLLTTKATWGASDPLKGERCAKGCGARKRVGSANCWDHRGTWLGWAKVAGAWVLLSKEERDGR